MWKIIAPIISALILLITMGCGNMDQPTKANDHTLNNNENVRTTLDIKKKNQKIHFVLAIENQFDEAISLTFMSGKQFEIIVYDPNNQELYNTGEGKMYTQVINEIALKPGERKEWTDVWKGPLEKGEYRVVGLITASEIKPTTINLDNLVIDETLEIK